MLIGALLSLLWNRITQAMSVEEHHSSNILGTLDCSKFEHVYEWCVGRGVEEIYVIKACLATMIVPLLCCQSEVTM